MTLIFLSNNLSNTYLGVSLFCFKKRIFLVFVNIFLKRYQGKGGSNPISFGFVFKERFASLFCVEISIFRLAPPAVMFLGSCYFQIAAFSSEGRKDLLNLISLLLQYSWFSVNCVAKRVR